ncbi:MAG: transposase [Clostridiaceae bacterium]
MISAPTSAFDGQPIIRSSLIWFSLRFSCARVGADIIRPHESKSLKPESNRKLDLRTRKKIRLSGYDYSASNAYFITICVTNKYALLWDMSVETILPDHPPLSQTGQIVETAIQQIPVYYKHVIVEKFCIMPDHVHLLMFLTPDESEGSTSKPTLSTVIGSLKRWVTKQVGYSIWQKSFYDEIIHDDVGYQEVCQYIAENPTKYKEDRVIS